MTTTGIDLSRVHLVGIGGSGMSGVARILIDRGSAVSGSDAKDSRPVRVLEQAGARIAVGHAAENLSLTGQPPTVVVTSFAAIPQDNPELVAARDNGIPVIRRSELLAELMEGSHQVLFAGTHGKTSTTSMAVVAMQAAGLNPSFAIGGQLNKAGTNAHHGTGDSFVAEADESDASLLGYRPDVAVVTNIEPDHLDYFKTEEAYFQVFADFAEQVTDDGHLVVCLDDDNAAGLGSQAAARGVAVLGYGTTAALQRHPDIAPGVEITGLRPTETGSEITVRLWIDGKGARLAEPVEQTYVLAMPGEHMALNSAAALLAGVLADGAAGEIVRGLREFTGVRRRFEHHGTVAEGAYAGVRVYDDYAHHPTEVEAVLKAARQTVEAEVADDAGTRARGRVVACFQPHLYSRTIEFAEEFAQALSLADAVVVLDIFGARETPVEGVSSRIITDRITDEGIEVAYEASFIDAPATVVSLTEPGDLVITMGAGTVTMLAPEILSELGG